MAKAKAAAPEAVEGTETATTPAEPKAPRVSNVKYTFQKDLAEGQKFAPQAMLLLKHIQAAGANGINRKALCEALTADEAFKTRQPVERIVSYYQKDLVNAGLIAQS
jgi:hypothetical protein